MTRRFHVVAVNERTGKVTRVTAFPLSHGEACTMMRKFAIRRGRRIQLQPEAGS